MNFRLLVTHKRPILTCSGKLTCKLLDQPVNFVVGLKEILDNSPIKSLLRPNRSTKGHLTVDLARQSRAKQHVVSVRKRDANLHFRETQLPMTRLHNSYIMRHGHHEPRSEAVATDETHCWHREGYNSLEKALESCVHTERVSFVLHQVWQLEASRENKRAAAHGDKHGS